LTEASPATELAERSLSLYRDRLLGSEDVTGMLIALRDRLAAKFMQLVVDQGAALEAHGDWRAATMLYERGLARETLAEPIHRALMRAHLELGERAEALRTYRRCKQLLLAVLGTEPSPQTQALAKLASEVS
jgi:DNA-binding SARP family transcriptional activator